MLKMTKIKPGKYVVAVSGGIDSMAMLHALASEKAEGLQFEVAYIDHGWRETSRERKLVEEMAEAHSLPFHFIKLSLKGESEGEARTARYAALEKLRQEIDANAVVTGHHLDDRIETLIMNIMRGTGRRGLVPLRSEETVIRPLLKAQRKGIETYAHQHGLKWVEDPTNADTRYRRNLIRNEALPTLRRDDADFRDYTLKLLDKLEKIDAEITIHLAVLWRVHGSLRDNEASMPLAVVKRLDIDVVQELVVDMAHRVHPHAELDADAVERLAIDLKTGHVHAPRQLTKLLSAQVSRGTFTIAFIAS